MSFADGMWVAGKMIALKRPKLTLQTTFSPQPVVLDDDRIFITAGYGYGCAMFQIKPTPAGKLAAISFTDAQPLALTQQQQNDGATMIADLLPDQEIATRA